MKHTTLKFVRKATPNQLQELLFLMAEAHPTHFEELIDQQLGGVKTSLSPVLEPTILRTFSAYGVTIQLTTTQLEQLRTYNTNKVACIREVRMITGRGLKETKDIIETQAFIQAIGAIWA